MLSSKDEEKLRFRSNTFSFSQFVVDCGKLHYKFSLLYLVLVCLVSDQKIKSSTSVAVAWTDVPAIIYLQKWQNLCHNSSEKPYLLSFL